MEDHGGQLVSGYKVLAACVIAEDQNGLLHHYYENAYIPWLSSKQAKHFLAEGLVEKASGTVEADGDTGTVLDGEVDVEAEQPPRSAPKADWVDYAVSTGSYTAEEADALTKAELIDAVG